jgi:ribosomal protein S25
MAHPSQQFSMNGSHTKSRSYKPKITPEDAVKTVPKLGYISHKQLARKLNVSPSILTNVLKKVEMGVEIEMFFIGNKEKLYKRVKNETNN